MSYSLGMSGRLSGHRRRQRRLGNHRGRRGFFSFLLFVSVSFVLGHLYSASAARGANLFKSIFKAKLPRFFFGVWLPAKGPARTKKLRDPPFLSYPPKI